MRRELPRQPVRNWLIAPVRCHHTPEVAVTEISLSNFEGLVAVAKTAPDEFGYVVIGRVIDRSRADPLERKDVDAEALAAFLPLRDASVAPDPAELAEAALAWARMALGKFLGDADELTLKVSIFRPKGIGTLRSRRVVVSRVVQLAAAAPESVPPANVAPCQAAATPSWGLISRNGPTWRRAIREQEAAGVPVSDMLRTAASLAEQAEREGVPQLPVSRETIEALRQSPQLGTVPALPATDQPSILYRKGGQFVSAGRSAGQRQEAVEAELERALYRFAGRSLVGMVDAAADLSSATASLLSGVAGVVARAR